MRTKDLTIPRHCSLLRTWYLPASWLLTPTTSPFPKRRRHGWVVWSSTRTLYTSACVLSSPGARIVRQIYRIRKENRYDFAEEPWKSTWPMDTVTELCSAMDEFYIKFIVKRKPHLHALKLEGCLYAVCNHYCVFFFL